MERPFCRYNGDADTSIQDTKTDQPGAKVVIGADGATNTTPGILVLSDSDKAMILPKVANASKYYETCCGDDSIWFRFPSAGRRYNGKKLWSFWKPE